MIGSSVLYFSFYDICTMSKVFCNKGYLVDGIEKMMELKRLKNIIWHLERSSIWVLGETLGRSRVWSSSYGLETVYNFCTAQKCFEEINFRYNEWSPACLYFFPVRFSTYFPSSMFRSRYAFFKNFHSFNFFFDHFLFLLFPSLSSQFYLNWYISVVTRICVVTISQIFHWLTTPEK